MGMIMIQDMITNFFDFGGTIVKAGCTLYGYENEHFHDDANEYDVPKLYANGCPFGDDHFKCNREMDNNFDHWGWSSFKCRCKQDPIICSPSDSWVTIDEIDNTDNDNKAKATYTKVIGTTWTSEASESMSIDSTIEESMSAGFFNFFSDDIGISVATGYDWTHTSSEAKSETETFTVETTVDAHSILIIEGAEGECGGNNVKTELFKLTSVDENGNVIKQTLEYMNGNKTITIALWLQWQLQNCKNRKINFV